jgi:type I restriction enzyme M protein
MSDTNLSTFIWPVANLLRGDYKQSEYGKVILPFSLLRRLDCVLEPAKHAVLDEGKKRMAAPDAYTLMSTQALNSPSVQNVIKDIMLNHAKISEAFELP